MKLLPPTAEEIRAARKAAHLTTQQACELIHQTYERGWRRYESGDTIMHPAFWDLFLRRIKELNVEDKENGK